MPSHSQMILAYLQEDGLSLEEQAEVLKSALRSVEHMEVMEQLNKPNKQIAINFEGCT